ncbi:MAG: type II toxin-antitoxin system VapC family toxin [Nostoc sp. ChiQUE02]|uniref:type II toxin-antitoxin system VapC family toxin n=1 Tax=Nostoc sp. ChiQUE02 TaxID=3075377 RepID=UPI002AD4B650|nr:VapC toxin family PIN domain ribonuclease [Nostoc sp. ChiQUE02]MDZ8230878.1 VapC toxin family PIN domain ribonuclease [Nostoc sp. ChiQUE02]
MTYYPLILADSGFLFAYYSARDQYHQQVRRFFESCTSRLLTRPICIAEVVWLLNLDWRTQNEFLLDVAKQLYECEQLLPQDFSRIAELNTQYRDLPGDFADLSLIVISERLDIAAMPSLREALPTAGYAYANLDSDFDIYRRYRKKPFERVF